MKTVVLLVVLFCVLNLTQAGGGGGCNNKFCHSVNVDIDKDKNINEIIDIFKKVKSRLDIDGNLATSTSTASAEGDNTLAETDSHTLVEDGKSVSMSESVSASEPDKCYYWWCKY
eukprot:TRINITY_DN23013_c0_g2_i2.p5 TRINITY_DN23013_c0_g2~~TRINITY_DN23013_c0_g2_i2.p5  ORF type:complete len:115 (-),score=16.40 TRINITY_DN23013_c0_g2_i2:1128-1472(-)